LGVGDWGIGDWGLGTGPVTWKYFRVSVASYSEVHRNVQRFRSGLVFKSHRLCVSLNSRLESNEEEREGSTSRPGQAGWLLQVFNRGFLVFSSSLLSRLELSDTHVYEP